MPESLGEQVGCNEAIRCNKAQQCGWSRLTEVGERQGGVVPQQQVARLHVSVQHACVSMLTG